MPLGAPLGAPPGMPPKNKRKGHAGMFKAKRQCQPPPPPVVAETRPSHDTLASSDDESTQSSEEEAQSSDDEPTKQSQITTHFGKKKGRKRGSNEVSALGPTSGLLVPGRRRRTAGSTTASSDHADTQPPRVQMQEWSLHLDALLTTEVFRLKGHSRKSSIPQGGWDRIAAAIGPACGGNAARRRFERLPERLQVQQHVRAGRRPQKFASREKGDIEELQQRNKSLEAQLRRAGLKQSDANCVGSPHLFSEKERTALCKAELAVATHRLQSGRTGETGAESDKRHGLETAASRPPKPCDRRAVLRDPIENGKAIAVIGAMRFIRNGMPREDAYKRAAEMHAASGHWRTIQNWVLDWVKNSSNDEVADGFTRSMHGLHDKQHSLFNEPNVKKICLAYIRDKRVTKGKQEPNLTLNSFHRHVNAVILPGLFLPPVPKKPRKPRIRTEPAWWASTRAAAKDDEGGGGSAARAESEQQPTEFSGSTTAPGASGGSEACTDLPIAPIAPDESDESGAPNPMDDGARHLPDWVAVFLRVMLRRVRKNFPRHGWHDGTVKAYDPDSGLCTVVYDDDDSEIVPLNEVEPILVQHPTPTEHEMAVDEEEQEMAVDGEQQPHQQAVLAELKRVHGISEVPAPRPVRSEARTDSGSALDQSSTNPPPAPSPPPLPVPPPIRKKRSKRSKVELAKQHAARRGARNPCARVLCPTVGRTSCWNALNHYGFEYNVKGGIYKDGWMRADVQEDLHTNWLPTVKRIEKSKKIYDGPDCIKAYLPVLAELQPEFTRMCLDQACGKTHHDMFSWEERGTYTIAAKNEGAIVHFSIITSEERGRCGFRDEEYAAVRSAFQDEYAVELQERSTNDMSTCLLPQYVDNVMEPKKGNWWTADKAANDQVCAAFQCLLHSRLAKFSSGLSLDQISLTTFHGACRCPDSSPPCSCCMAPPPCAQCVR